SPLPAVLSPMLTAMVGEWHTYPWSAYPEPAIAEQSGEIVLEVTRDTLGAFVSNQPGSDLGVAQFQLPSEPAPPRAPGSSLAALLDHLGGYPAARRQELDHALDPFVPDVSPPDATARSLLAEPLEAHDDAGFAARMSLLRRWMT